MSAGQTGIPPERNISPSDLGELGEASATWRENLIGVRNISRQARQVREGKSLSVTRHSPSDLGDPGEASAAWRENLSLRTLRSRWHSQPTANKALPDKPSANRSGRDETSHSHLPHGFFAGGSLCRWLTVPTALVMWTVLVFPPVAVTSCGRARTTHVPVGPASSCRSRTPPCR